MADPLVGILFPYVQALYKRVTYVEQQLGNVDGGSFSDDGSTTIDGGYF